MIYLTEKASKKIIDISDSEGLGHYNVRVRVVGGGCAGFSYDMYFEEKIGEMDEIFDLDNIKIVIDPLSFQYTDEMTIDYIDSPMGGGFKFINPNSTGQCGCGSSVSF